jgi:hypothetical protein
MEITPTNLKTIQGCIEKMNNLKTESSNQNYRDELNNVLDGKARETLDMADRISATAQELAKSESKKLFSFLPAHKSFKNIFEKLSRL